MLGINDDYFSETIDLMSHYNFLKKTKPNNKYLRLVEFDRNKIVSLKPKFWKKFGPKDKTTPNYKFHTFANANKRLKIVLEKAKKKGLVSKFH